MRSGYFRTPEELRDYYSALGVLDGKPIVVSCGSGVSACVDLIGMELAGISDGLLCPGSFSGWIAHGLPSNRGCPVSLSRDRFRAPSRRSLRA